MPLYVFRTYSFTADTIVAALWVLAGLAFFRLRWRGPQKPSLWLAIFLFGSLAVAIPLGWGSTFNADARVLPPLLVKPSPPFFAGRRVPPGRGRDTL
jgi:hypothetical protein